MPSTGVLVAITTENSWKSEVAGQPVRLSYIATDSAQRLSFVSLQSATHIDAVLRIASRPSHFEDLADGVVIEVHLSRDLEPGDAVHLSLGHSGANIYYPPQQIDDLH